ncbi:hypothetical protein CI41S_56610 [Bradyrhizobium ivorense]|nr:hypothetical protein [Bradyrhizobium ivorense]VIO77406.1 hypothetical protein CI41S_56610 [Bradyrhizobium ivorense]
MAFSDRIPYQALVDRPKLTLPGGKKLAVWVILNVEEWRIENAMPRTVLSPPMGQPLLPDVPNWSWHEYGMRAGFWRQFKALTERNIPVTLAINANVCNTYPRGIGGARGRLRVHGTWLYSGPDAQGREPGGRDQALGRHHRELYRETAAVVGKSGPDRD